MKSHIHIVTCAYICGPADRGNITEEILFAPMHYYICLDSHMIHHCCIQGISQKKSSKESPSCPPDNPEEKTL